MFRSIPRMTGWLLLAVALVAVIAFVSPQQLPVVAYKLSLISLAVITGYWLDRSLYPYARPDSYLERDWRHGTDEADFDVDYRIVPGHHWVFCAAMIRRAMVVGAVVLAVALGL
ncbi:putative holin [Comamonas testosteroni]|uniref:putative holin n=1 Tax=Comamonas testosteroni TaxID=285 RepID=UPI0028EE5491|nr:putative holin [Comamonas testosteroni]